MAEFLQEIFEDVRNGNGFQFFRLKIDGECQFDEFYAKIMANPKAPDYKSMIKVIALMDFFGYQLLPKTKFMKIEDLNRSDVFEFKANNIRVYVVLRKPNVYIVMGGYKNEQKKDINVLGRKIKEF